MSEDAAKIEWKLVPTIPVEVQWGELARDIVMWLYMSSAPHYGSKLHRHLRSLGREVPAWLLEEIPDADHTPAKGTIAACIYVAMVKAAPEAPNDTMTAEEARSGQHWAGMDGAIAWHLIDRHANGWGDVGRMMDAWLAANVERRSREGSNPKGECPPGPRAKPEEPGPKDAPKDKSEAAGNTHVGGEG